MISSDQPIIIIGAGLAGSLMAAILGKMGFKVEVYESRSDLRKTTNDAGKSINLALSHRGLSGLKLIGLDNNINQIVIPMRGRLIHDVQGNTKFQPYGKDDTEVINSVSRADLNAVLLNEAEKNESVQIFFNHKCKGYDHRKKELRFEKQDGTILVISNINRLIAADGALSTVRTSVLPVGTFNYSQTYLEYGYKELEIPPGKDETFQIEKNALHIWPRSKFLMIALPNPDKSFTLTLFAPFEGENSFEQLQTEDKIKTFFENNFPDVVDLIPKLTENFMLNPTGKLVTIKCNPYNIGNSLVLIGDAAHAIIPFYGQGMNAAFEDCRVLAEQIDSCSNWKSAIRNFSKLRKPNADAIADLSYDNFVEMRDKVADDKFLLRKQAELMLYKKFPDIISKYAMVTFHPELSYEDAKRKGDILEQTIEEMFDNISNIDEFNPQEAREIILRKYSSVSKT